jgi:hypothetical protein
LRMDFFAIFPGADFLAGDFADFFFAGLVGIGFFRVALVVADSGTIKDCRYKVSHFSHKN